MNSFILLAGGKGSRMEQDLPKQFLMLAGKPVIMHIMERLEHIDEISEVIVVCIDDYKKYIEDYINKYRLKKPYILVNGGKTRQDSVLNGLEVAKYETVILHEAARPFVTIEDFKRLIINEHSNVTYGKEIHYTVLKRDNNFISGILDRETLINVQLPQKFGKTALINAHYKAREDGRFFTEDASLLSFYTSKKINIINGKDYNIKLTTNLDLIIAEEIYKEYMVVN